MIARTRFGPFQFALVALGLATLVAGAMLVLVGPSDPVAVRWAITGWGLMTVIGVLSGAGLVRFHGQAAHGFFVVIGAALLVRLVSSAVGAWGAATAGERAIGPYLTGLAAGYLPLQLLELGFFLRRTRTA